MSEKTYSGSCHCQKVRYEVKMDLSKEVTACNCSLCGRAGWLLAFTPAQNFKLLAGEGEQSDYQFNKKHLHHLFCKTCGVRSFSQGPGPNGEQWVGVNVRCLDGVEADALHIKRHDGRAQ